MNEVFKIQKPILGFVWLIYNEDRSILLHMSQEYVSAELLALMGDKNKVYVTGHIDNESLFHVEQLVEDQQW